MGLAPDRVHRVTTFALMSVLSAKPPHNSKRWAETPRLDIETKFTRFNHLAQRQAKRMRLLADVAIGGDQYWG